MNWRTLRGWLQLARISNLPTALADVLAGFFLAGGALAGVDWRVALALVCSGGVYSAGMIMNDVADIDIDAQERAFRPLPSGVVTRRSAACVAGALALVGVAAAFAAGVRLGVVALALLVAAACYDLRGERRLFDISLLGLCRSLNVLLGAAACGAWTGGPHPPAPVLAGMAAVGVHTMSLSAVARGEADDDPMARDLCVGAVLSLSTAVVLFGYTIAVADADLHAILLLAVFVAASLGAVVVAFATGRRIPTVKLMLRLIVALDALLVFGIAGEVPALVVLALIVPAWILARVSYPT